LTGIDDELAGRVIERIGKRSVHLRDPVVGRRGRQVGAGSEVAARLIEDLARPVHAHSSHGGQSEQDVGVLDRVQHIGVEHRDPDRHERCRQS
jgi:hypothetical protein